MPKAHTIKFGDDSDPRWIAFLVWFQHLKDTSVSYVSMPDAVAEAVRIASKTKGVKK